MDGEPGDDTLRGGDGRDSFSGGEGDDLLHGGLNGAGPDTFVGGPGTDTVTYALAGTGVTVTIFDPLNVNASQAPDGQAGENDVVQGDVENVTGSGNGDTLTGNNLANRIDGSNGDDTIAGGTGPDVLLGGEGNDAINSRDGEADPLIDCGPGTSDSANLDLVNRPRGSSRLNPLGSPVNCESTFFFATDDGPPGRLTQSVLRPDANGHRTSAPRLPEERPRRLPRNPAPAPAEGSEADPAKQALRSPPRHDRRDPPQRAGITARPARNAGDHGEGRLPKGPARHREDRGGPIGPRPGASRPDSPQPTPFGPRQSDASSTVPIHSSSPKPSSRRSTRLPRTRSRQPARRVSFSSRPAA